MADDVVIIKPTNAIVEITAPGPQGVAASAQIFYTHTQLDSAGTQCEGTFSYPTVNQMVITFTAAFSGVAYVI